MALVYLNKDKSVICEIMDNDKVFISSICGCELAVIAGYKDVKKMNINDTKIEVKAWRETSPANGDYGLTEMEINYFFDSTNTKEELEEFINFVHKACPLHATISKAVKIVSNIHKMGL